MRALKAQLHILEAHSSFLHLPNFFLLSKGIERTRTSIKTPEYS